MRNSVNSLKMISEKGIVTHNIKVIITSDISTENMLAFIHKYSFFFINLFHFFYEIFIEIRL